MPRFPLLKAGSKFLLHFTLREDEALSNGVKAQEKKRKQHKKKEIKLMADHLKKGERL